MTDKRELERTIEELEVMLREAQDAVDRTGVEVSRAEAIVDGTRECLTEVEGRLAEADLQHSVAYARVEALCCAIATVRRQYVKME